MSEVEIARLRDENERLRAALEEIVKNAPDEGGIYAERVARVALKGGGEIVVPVGTDGTVRTIKLKGGEDG